MLQNPAMLENPGFSPNQITGAFTRANLMAYGTAAAGVAVGLLVADFADRYVATRKPADSASPAVKAVSAWYGRDAAAAQRMRPDAWRLATQAGGAVVALGLAYWTRGQRILPWLLGGTAIGFGANLLKMLADWWLMPAILKTKADNEVSFANRMYPLEQSAIQDSVAEIFKNWANTASLAAGQTDPPTVMSPLNPAGSPDVYTLGKAGLFARSALAGRTFVQTGRLGNCPSCNGNNGCYSDCSTLCPDCPGYMPHKKCVYTVMAAGEIEALAAQASVSLSDVAAMNGGKTVFVVGDSVTLPYGMCMRLQSTGPSVPPAVVAPGGGPVYAYTGPPGNAVTPAYPTIMGIPETAKTNGNGNGHVAIPPVPANPEISLYSLTSFED